MSKPGKKETDTTPQIATSEVSDSNLDNVAGGKSIAEYAADGYLSTAAGRSDLFDSEDATSRNGDIGRP